MSTNTAELTKINQHFPDGWFDAITVRDAAGNELDTIWVESSEDPEPYDRALVAAGYGGAAWIQ